MKRKRKFRKIEKLMDSWIGCIIYIILGLLMAYLFFKSNVSFYLFIPTFVILFYLLEWQKELPSIYGSVLLAFGTYKFIGLVLGTPLPLVAVVSPSMQHDNPGITHYQWLEKNLGYNKSYIDSWPIKNGFNVGDMPVVIGSKNYKVGDVIVYSIPNSKYPIIHRIVKINDDGTFQTKGDNNLSQLPYELKVKKEQIYGRVIFIIPKLGYFKVILNKIFGV